MRIGELASINFRSNPAHRIIESKISGCDKVEIIINTEKIVRNERFIFHLMLISSLLNISERLKGIWLKIISLCLGIVLNYHLSLLLMY